MTDLIVALDFNTEYKTQVFLSQTNYLPISYKIGLEMITAGFARPIAQQLIDAGKQVFWDGKFYDIPNTMEKAVKALPTGIWCYSAHARTGVDAVILNRLQTIKSNVCLVPSLTSHDRLFKNNIVLSEIAYMVNFVVGSVEDCRQYRMVEHTKNHTIITPGIRPNWYPFNGDQKQVATPKEAKQAGSSYIVVGRPITVPTQQMSYRDAIIEILNELEK